MKICLLLFTICLLILNVNLLSEFCFKEGSNQYTVKLGNETQYFQHFTENFKKNHKKAYGVYSRLNNRYIFNVASITSNYDGILIINPRNDQGVK